MSSAEETIGWMAALAAMLSFGSFGVPIKSERSNSVDIDPLVFQSYKSIMVFFTSWLVLLNPKYHFSFTPWGIVSCIFWVPGGVATVFAIRNAGLGIAIGIGSSTIVLISFIWGIFIFQEDIHSKFMACIAIGLMMTGIVGMSYYSAPTTILLLNHEDHHQHQPEFIRMNTITASPSENDTVDVEHIIHQRRHSPLTDGGLNKDSTTNGPLHATIRTAQMDSFASSSSSNTELHQDQGDRLEQDIFVVNDDDEQLNHHHPAPTSSASNTRIQIRGAHNPSEILHICGMQFTRRQLGIAAATFNGVWGGSIMAPMRWCKDNTAGVGYLISFGIGAAVVTLALWVIRFIYNLVYYQGSPLQAYQALPSFHWRVMWLPGGTSGLLWSIGNFFSLISVFYLGEGVGYSVVQAGMLVSGLWGIFYFHEITGMETIAKWIASACITICGIILLSYEHHKK